MKTLQEFLTESLSGDLKKVVKWLDDEKNSKRLAKKNNIDNDLMSNIFSWIEGSVEHVGSFDGLIDFVGNDGPDNFPEYAEDELGMDEDTLENYDWYEIFDNIVSELEKL